MTLHARVAIIGGGIYGCALAHQLVEKGWTDVIVVEKNELAAGSTWHAAGFCTHYSFNPTHVFMRKFSTELYQRLELEGRTPTGYHRCRGLRVTNDLERMAEFRHGAEVGRALGIDFEIISAKEIESIVPLMNTEGVAGALLEPIDGYVDPTQATNAMASLARKGGATILRGSPVHSIEVSPSGEWALSTPGKIIIAEHIVIAAGFWAHEVGQMIGLELPIVPMLHQYLVTEDHPAVKACAAESIPLIRHHDHQWYLRRERDGLVLGAYESKPLPWSVKGVPSTFGMELLEPDLGRIEHLLLDAINRIPVLGEVGIKTAVHGPISYTPDGQPLVGPAPGIRNAWIAAGSSFGIGEGAGAGHLLAEWMVHGAAPMHMWAFDPRRFGHYADFDYRVSKAIEVYANQFSTHFPLEEREGARPKHTTAIYVRLKSAGARFGCVYGWERANWFAANDEPHTLSFARTAWFDAVARECKGLSETAGVIDLSGFSKYRVRGRDAEHTLGSLSANRLPTKVGDLRLCHFLNHHGRIECEFTIARLAKDDFYLVCAAPAKGHHLDWLKGHTEPGARVEFEDLTASRGVLGLSGPLSREILQPLCENDLSNQRFPWLTSQSVNIAGIDVQAIRVSYTGELGWELHHHAKDQCALYDALMHDGRALKPINVGFYALNSLRMEKAYKAWGVELTTENTPWELGLDRFVSIKNRAFIGRDALCHQHKTGIDKRFVYVEIDSNHTDVIGAEPVYAGSERVGVMVSGAYGHRVGKNLGFAQLFDQRPPLDQPLSTNMLGENHAIRIIEEPAFDPSNSRLRS